MRGECDFFIGDELFEDARKRWCHSPVTNPPPELLHDIGTPRYVVDVNIINGGCQYRDCEMSTFADKNVVAARARSIFVLFREWSRACATKRDGFGTSHAKTVTWTFTICARWHTVKLEHRFVF